MLDLRRTDDLLEDLRCMIEARQLSGLKKWGAMAALGAAALAGSGRSAKAQDATPGASPAGGVAATDSRGVADVSSSSQFQGLQKKLAALKSQGEAAEGLLKRYGTSSDPLESAAKKEAVRDLEKVASQLSALVSGAHGKYGNVPNAEKLLKHYEDIADRFDAAR